MHCFNSRCSHAANSHLVLACGLILLVMGSTLQAANVGSYRSKNFIVHSDDDPDRSKELLERLETLLKIVSEYWRRPNRRLIECCVVKDLKNWPSGRLPQLAIEKIRSKSGVTISVKRMQGTVFFTKSIVYAAARTGVAQHEAVHAYCYQMFGSTGPVWYSEGMAEMGRYWASHNDRGVHGDDGPIRYLRKTAPPSVKTLTRTGQTSDGWRNYAQRWALCHLLSNNPNYGQRFRTLGFSLLGGRPGTSFQSFFGTMSREIQFEYDLFLRNLENGYRVDLCTWDWKTRFRRLKTGRTAKSTIDAGRGWQASGISVQAGLSYSVTASGDWQTSTGVEAVDADGDSRGVGRLQAVIWNNYQLTRSSDLSRQATFKPSGDGKLFLRCGDRWGSLHDNTGQLTVRVKLVPRT